MDGSKREKITLKIRLDYRGNGRGGRRLFGGKNITDSAEEIREQKVSFFRNVPMQGVAVNDIDANAEVYAVIDDSSGEQVAYAPIILTVTAENIENVLQLIMQEEFRKVEVIEPQTLALDRGDMERLLFRISEELRRYHRSLERKWANR